VPASAIAHVKQRHRACAAAATAPVEGISPVSLLDNLFQDMCNHHEIKTPVRLNQSTDGRGIGLFATEGLAKGATILRVPRSLCIVIDNDSGSMTIPNGGWPRLSGGLMQDNALTCEWCGSSCSCCCCCCRRRLGNNNVLSVCLHTGSPQLAARTIITLFSPLSLCTPNLKACHRLLL
jgi:hypothetical protein